MSCPARVVVLLASIATAQTPQWNFLDGPAHPGRMATYDWARRRLVTFGMDGATWEFAGDRMLHRHVAPGSRPSPRSRAATVFDLQRRRVLLFGGLETTGTLSQETWAWDGIAWTQLTALPQPLPRVDAAIAYDILRDRVVMFGGQQLWVGQHRDTWEHDGQLWIQRAPSNVPGPNSPVMTYDLLRGVTVLIEHTGFVNTPVATWEWDGIDWLLRSTAGPTSGSNEGMAYDLARARTVLFGGVGASNEIWEWDGATWHRTPLPSAPARINPAVQFDPMRGTISIRGGIDFTMSGYSVIQGSARTDAWEWNGSVLTRVHPDLRPSSRNGHVWVADRTRGNLVLFGGHRQQTAVDETWTWDGNTWTERSPATRPPARTAAAATHDSIRGEVLVFGGSSAGALRRDLWAWNGADWTLRDTGTGPSERYGAGFAFDDLRGRAVLFGGIGSQPVGGTTRRNDTWEWDGSAWTQRLPAAAPSPRESPALAFDPARGRVVLFGGRTGAGASQQLGDTWEWDGSNWLEVVTPLSPPALLQPALCHLAGSNELLLTGIHLVGSTMEVQIWRYEGHRWTYLHRQTSDQLGGPTATDPRRDRLVCNKGVVIAEWTTTPGVVNQHGPGCGAPAPVLLARARPRLGEPGFGFETRGQPFQPAVLCVAGAPGSVSLGHGCVLHLGGALANVFVLGQGTGDVEVLVPIPAAVGLRGLTVYAQAVILDGSAMGGFRLSQALAVGIGD